MKIRYLLSFFESLKLEIQCYDYGKIGHFWVEGYEYLRQLEYRIAILRDKVDYLGEQKNCCTKEERKFALHGRISTIKLLLISFC